MFSNTLLMAFRAIRQNLMRSALTILGIVIGTGAVVTLVTIGQGATKKVTDDIKSMGENLLMIHPGGPHRPGRSYTPGAPLELSDATAIRQEIRGAEYVAPTNQTGMVVIFGNTNWSTTITGTMSDLLHCRGYTIARGRTFTKSEETGMKPVCILGNTVAENLFGAADPLGQSLRVGKMPCTIIGLLKSKGQSMMGMDQDDIILLPIRVFQRRIAGQNNVSQISVSVSEDTSSTAVKRDIEFLMRERRHIGPNDPDDFTVRDLQEIISRVQETTSVMTALLSAIAAVSLLVGGIGIMNIMLVSVTERTREIGIRMAIGATRAEVRLQFLVEAAVLSGFGGLFGLIIGNVGAYFATQAMEMPYVPSPVITVVALFFSLGVGVLFGSLPAHRASKLDPMEALRHE
jgi:putative ABC transport system permease protein